MILHRPGVVFGVALLGLAVSLPPALGAKASRMLYGDPFSPPNLAVGSPLAYPPRVGQRPPHVSFRHKLKKAREKIRHVIVIMQENRSFDSYFGTFPRADGIPVRRGVPTVCVPDPVSGQCVTSFHDPNDLNRGGPHKATDAVADIDGGKMDGFVAQAAKARLTAPRDVMGYHDAREIPNYWAYAKHFVLQDHMFEPNASWSLPEHLFMVSGWSASCSRLGDPASCVNAPNFPPTPGPGAHYDWTDLTYLLHRNNVSWAYYLSNGTEPDCEDDSAICPPKSQGVTVPGIWNPLPDFFTVQQDGQLGKSSRRRTSSQRQRTAPCRRSRGSCRMRW